MEKINVKRALKLAEGRDRTIKREKIDGYIVTNFLDIIREGFFLGLKEVAQLTGWLSHEDVYAVMGLIRQIEKFHKRFNDALDEINRAYVEEMPDGSFDVPKEYEEQYKNIVKSLEEVKIKIRHRPVTLPIDAIEYLSPWALKDLKNDFFVLATD
jgi:hypothetical protein